MNSAEESQNATSTSQSSFSVPSPGKVAAYNDAIALINPRQYPSPSQNSVSGPSHHASPSTRKRAWEGDDDQFEKPYPTSHSVAQQRLRHATSWSRRRSSRSLTPDESTGIDSAVISRDQSTSPPPISEATAPAPMVSLREVALLSPDKNEELSTHESNTTGMGLPVHPQIESGAKQRHDKAVLDMQNMQQKQGWTRDRIAEASAERRHFFEQTIMPEPDNLHSLDALHTGLINEDDCDRLFDLYYRYIHTQHGMSDPAVETWKTVRARSRALFITKIACAAAVDQNDRSRKRRESLINNMEEVVTRLLLANAKSADIVKVFILAYLFVQKSDSAANDRCWLLVDAANRAAAELGLGVRLRSSRVSIVDTDHFVDRNQERAWICAAVMQRSLGTSTGQWSLTKLDVKWDKLEAWSESKMALPGDVQLVAYLVLRRIEYQARSDFERIDSDRMMTLESVRAGFNALFDCWQRRWVKHPKLVGHDFLRNFLKTISMHIQLLLNITALKLAEGGRRRKKSYYRDMSEHCREDCYRMASELCTHFLDSFQGKAHYLCRNIVSMVVWGAMALVQMEPEKGRFLALNVALTLAGDANDLDFKNNLSSFYGRSLLSMINDLAGSTGNLYRKRSHSITHRGRQRTKDTSSVVASTNGTVASAINRDGRNSSIASASPNPRSISSDTSRTDGAFDAGKFNPERHVQEQMWSAEKMLSSMAAPLSADPFNEAWLNQFLDNIAPSSAQVNWSQDLQAIPPSMPINSNSLPSHLDQQSMPIISPQISQPAYNIHSTPTYDIPTQPPMQMF
ncbi:hypothetical protein L7F22_037269 [Adiantum nelumboides]|nr:hypothetical protein [Adiantum nelumboides]